MEKLQAQVEDLERKRSKWLIINLIGFCVWNGLRIVDSYLLDNNSSQILVGIILFGGLIWTVGLVQIIRLGKKTGNNKQVLQILNDELIEANRFKAWRIALIAVVLTQVLIIIVSLVTEISGLLAAELTIFVSVTSAIGSFLFFNSQSDA